MEFRAKINIKHSDSDEVRKLVNGKIAILNKCEWSNNDDDYVLYGFEDEEIDKAFWWEVEQGNLFSIYKNYRKFSEAYDNGDYDAEACIVFNAIDFERI